MRKTIIGISILIITFVADITTKSLVERRLRYMEEIKITNFLNIVRVHNRGIVFGFLGSANEKTQKFITAFSIISLTILIGYIILSYKSLEFYPAMIILGGAIGNVSEKITKGYVVDFIDLHIGKYHWPAFNIADSSIVVGVIIIFLLSIKKKKENEIKEKEEKREK